MPLTLCSPCCAVSAAGPGYQPAVVVAFYAPYLVVPLLLALHMVATPQPFGSSAGKAKRQ